MLPEVETDFTDGYEVEEEPSLTWKLDIENGRIWGLADGEDTVRQAVYCILNTERYETLIYSWDYGVEFVDLIGSPLNYAMTELARRAEEALTQDDRIMGGAVILYLTQGKKALSICLLSSIQHMGKCSRKKRWKYKCLRK